MLFESNCIFNILVLEYDSLIAIKFFEKTVFWMKNEIFRKHVSV